jgi:cyclase
MFRPRVIPVLLLKGEGLYKTVKFKNHNYIGDPINTVRIFNELNTDEIVIMDINASKENRLISLDFVKTVGEEANMPFSVAGGIKTIGDIKSILNAGAEKIILNTVAQENPDFIREAANYFGSSTITIAIDVKKNIFGRESIYFLNASKKSKNNFTDFCQLMEKNGAGELIIQSVDHDGTMLGYNLKIYDEISSKVNIPITALGGASNFEEMHSLYESTGVTGLAASSIFIYQGIEKGVLINYPENLSALFRNDSLNKKVKS